MRRALGRVAGLLLAGVAAVSIAACQRSDQAGPAAVSTSSGRLFVSDERGDAVVVVDPETGAVVRTVAVGKRPRGVVLSPDGTKLYVALSGSAIAGPGVEDEDLPPPDRTADGIGVINLSDLGIGPKVNAGNDPETFALSPDGQTLYVSNEDTAELSILNLNSGQIRAKIKVGDEPEGIAITPDGKIVYVACEASNSVYVIDVTASKVTAIIKMDGRPRSVVFTNDGSTAYVSNENSGHVTVVDVAASTIKTVIAIPDVGAGAGAPATPPTTAPAAGAAQAKGGSTSSSPTAPKPMGLAFSPDRAKLYVANGRGGTVAEIDTASNTVSRVIKDVGQRPWGITVSADGKHAFTANGPSGDISVINLTSGTVEKKIKVGVSPWGIAFAKAS